MPDLLLELRSEEIPARMQRKAAGDLKKLVTDGLVEAGLTYEACREYWTPRRLTLDLRGLTARSRDIREERKGPRFDAPKPAIQGFLRSLGIPPQAHAYYETLKVGESHGGEGGTVVSVEEGKGQAIFMARITRPGRAAEAIIAELIPAVIRGFPWPKAMRWGAASGPKGQRYGDSHGLGSDTLRWVRPLQSIVCTFGPETEEPVVVDFEVGGIRSGNITYGHRFHSPGAISVRRFDDYAAKLEAGKVVIDADRRKDIILSDARNLAFANGLDLVEDEALLEEVSGLVEWPVVLLGAFEEEFLAIPPEVIRLTIRANQKCFVCSPTSPLWGGRAEGAGGGDEKSSTPTPDLRSAPPHKGEGNAPRDLSNRFILTANIDARDGGAEIVHGNGKVVRARLSDALYFWKTDQGDLPDLDQLKPSAEKFGLDLAKPLDQRMARLDHLGVTFHAKLGTQGERVERIARLAEELALSFSPLAGGEDRSTEGREKAKDLAFSGTNARSESEGQGAQATEGGASEGTTTSSTAENTPPGQPSAGHPPRKGEGLAALARRAAVLAKADLTTEIVGEFPELQGVMGRKYAALQGEPPSVAAAIEEHWKPQGPSDRVPTDPVSIAVALADKLDTLVGFWAIDEKPTGSKDPYALRRAALGVIRIVVENGVRLGLVDILHAHQRTFLIGLGNRFGLIDRFDDLFDMNDPHVDDLIGLSIDPYLNNILNRSAKKRGFNWSDATDWNHSKHLIADIFYVALSNNLVAFTNWMPKEDTPLDAEDRARFEWLIESSITNVVSDIDDAPDLLAFFHDRLKVYLRDKGARHDLIDAVLAAGSRPISPRVGEMSAKPTEGGAVPPAGHSTDSSSTTPPSALPGISPTRGEIGQSDGAGPSSPAGPSPRERGEGGSFFADASRSGGAKENANADASLSPSLRGEGKGEGHSPAPNDDLLAIVRRVEALGSFLATEDGRNLLAGAKRAANILAAEAKKKTMVADIVDPALFRHPAEGELLAAVNQAESEAAQAIAREDFSGAMLALSAVREPVDSFFDGVLVNDDDPAVRANRLALLARIRAATDQVADFSKIAG